MKNKCARFFKKDIYMVLYIEKNMFDPKIMA